MKIKAYGICVYKKTKKSYEILLCKSILSKNKWGFLKGVQEKNETTKQTALREFYEESSLNVKDTYLEDFFIQENEFKDIGIYLVNYKNIKNIDKYFNNNELKEKYLCKENSEVKFFDINTIPEIKTKQNKISKKIINKLLK